MRPGSLSIGKLLLENLPPTVIIFITMSMGHYPTAFKQPHSRETWEDPRDPRSTASLLLEVNGENTKVLKRQINET